MTFRLKDQITEESEQKIFGEISFAEINSERDRTFCLLNWLFECDEYMETCRKDGNCDEHTKGALCNHYDVSGSPSCSCDNYDSHGY